MEEDKIAYSKRLKRNGSGPYRTSLQKRTSKLGKRRAKGLPCPARKKK